MRTLFLLASCWVVTLAGCGDDVSGAPPSPGDAAPMDAVADSLPGPDSGPPPGRDSCFEEEIALSAPDSDGAITATTPHYRLIAQTSPARVESLARLLESAWPDYLQFFGAPPTLPPEGRFTVRFLRDSEAYRAALVADGITGGGDAGGYYSPMTRVAYLYDQPTRYYSQTLLLHEAAHQFHGNLPGRVPGLPFWYIEGVAEYISRHDWDGQCARLGVRPLVTQEDMPARALDMLAGTEITLESLITEGDSSSRPLAYSVFRYFSETDGQRLAPAFRDFRAAVDRGEDILASFNTHLGSPSEHEEPWRRFLRDDQEPMTSVFLEHAHVGPAAVDAFSEFFSIAVLKEPVRIFEAQFSVPSESGWSGGVVLGYEAPSRWDALVVRESGRLQRFERAEAARWVDVDAAPEARDGRYDLQVVYSPGRVSVTINGASWEFDTDLPAISGIAVDSGSLRFAGIHWE